MFPSTFRQLEVFIAVADAGSFAAGAQQLGISQPSVSDHIGALERQMACKLFRRRRGSAPALTEQGRRLYERGSELLEQASQLSRELANTRPSTARKRVTICAQRFISQELLCDPVVDFARDNPDIEFIVEVAGYDEIVRKLLQGECDLGYFAASGSAIDVASECVGREPVAFYAAASHPLARRSRILPQELSAFPFITVQTDLRFGQLVNDLMRSAGVVDFPIAHQSGEGRIIQRLVAAGIGICSAFRRQMRNEVRAGIMVELPLVGPPLAIEIHQALTPKRKPSRAAARFAQQVRQHAAFRVAAAAQLT
jgi:DNA-binding transcriptional LysR family regulator